MATPPSRKRRPWPTAGAGTIAFGLPGTLWAFCPLLGGTFVVVEMLATLTITGTALFGSLALSERAFRLLCWIADRPEPQSMRAS
jgi:hypothetical protein